MQKKSFRHSSKDKLLLVVYLIIGLLIVVRFVGLDRFPVGITHDEADLLLSSNLFWQRGVDASGTSFPLSFVTTKMESGQTGITPFLLSPFFGLVSSNLFNAKLPFVIVNLISAWVIYLLLRNLTGHKYLAYLGSIVFLINPWSFLYSRSAIESPVCLLLVLSGTLVLFTGKKGSGIWSIVLFTLSFYAYLGAMPALLILVPLLFVINYMTASKRSLRSFLPLVLFFILSGTYLLIGKILPGSTLNNRSGELTNIFNQASFNVDAERKTVVDSQFAPLFANKGSEIIHTLSQKYLGLLSSDTLFFKGDPRATYRLGDFGFLYPVDLVFIIFGISALISIKEYRKLALIIGSFSLTAPLGSALSTVENSYFFRSFLILPVFVILITLGLSFLLQKISEKRRILFGLVSLGVYAICFLGFIYFYFFKFPVRQQENFYLSERIVSNYLRLNNSKAIIVSSSPIQLYQQYMFYVADTHIPEIPRNKIAVGNFIFTDNCPEQIDKGTVLIVKDGIKCNLANANELVVEDQKDSGSIYKIYNDSLCNNMNLVSYRRFNYLSDYKIEDMKVDQFCNRWMFRYEK